MYRLVIILLIIATQVVYGQNLSKEELTFGDRLLLVGVATVGFSIFDYVGYNLSRNNPAGLKVYRTFQLATQGLITYGLWKLGDWKCAVSFNLIWWTWGCDWAYYGIAHTVNPANPWENRTEHGLQNKVTWAYWTPVGIAKGFDRTKSIDKQTLAIQSGVGLTISIVILLD